MSDLRLKIEAMSEEINELLEERAELLDKNEVLVEERDQLRADLRKNELLLKAVREELGQVQRERDAVRSDINELLEENGRLLLAIQCGLTECNRLREAFKEYGSHKPNCDINKFHPYGIKCDCGFDQALAQKEGKA